MGYQAERHAVRTTHLVGLALLLPLVGGCWKSEATKRREVFDCSLTGQIAPCLQARYGWDETDASIEALRARINQ